MHGGDPGGSEAGVVVLRPVQRSRSTTLPFHVPVQGERVRWHPERGRGADDGSPEHLKLIG